MVAMLLHALKPFWDNHTFQSLVSISEEEGSVHRHTCPQPTCSQPNVLSKCAVRAQEAGVFAVVKDVFLPWYNAYR